MVASTIAEIQPLWIFREEPGCEMIDCNGNRVIWQRHYISWEDVQACIRKPDRTYTEYMAWQHFITDHSNAHCEDRYRAMRAIDTVHPITAHGDSPSPLYGDNSLVTALHRGNDWEMASALDGIGCSSFPLWQGIDDATFGTRIEMVASAANGKQIWLSELQGGRASTGVKLFQPVPGDKQQHWVWTGFGCGADVVLFWCWRDEVFGRESAGFGLNGRDGMAEERLAAMKASGKVLMDNEDLFANYRPRRRMPPSSLIRRIITLRGRRNIPLKS